MKHWIAWDAGLEKEKSKKGKDKNNQTVYNQVSNLTQLHYSLKCLLFYTL